MDPLDRTIQNGRTINVLDGMPFHTPLLKRGDPVVVVARMFLDVIAIHRLSASNRNHGKKLVERNPLCGWKLPTILTKSGDKNQFSYQCW